MLAFEKLRQIARNVVGEALKIAQLVEQARWNDEDFFFSDRGHAGILRIFAVNASGAISENITRCLPK
jgi:hypothetical protein